MTDAEKIITAYRLGYRGEIKARIVMKESFIEVTVLNVERDDCGCHYVIYHSRDASAGSTLIKNCGYETPSPVRIEIVDE